MFRPAPQMRFWTLTPHSAAGVVLAATIALHASCAVQDGATESIAGEREQYSTPESCDQLNGFARDAAHPMLGPNCLPLTYLPTQPVLENEGVFRQARSYLAITDDQARTLKDSLQNWVDHPFDSCGEKISRYERLFGSVLDEEQAARMLRLNAWLGGFYFLEDPALASQAGVRQDTHAKIAEIVRDSERRAMDIFRVFLFAGRTRGDRFSYAIDSTKLAVDTNARVVEQLSVQEKSALQAWLTTDPPPAMLIELVRAELNRELGRGAGRLNHKQRQP